MKKCMVFLMTALLFSATALAYDDLVTYGSSEVHEAGSMGIGAMLLYLSAGDVIDADGEKQSLDDNNTDFRLPLGFGYSPIDNLDAFVLLPIVSVGSMGESESGIGDIWLGAQYGILEEGLLSVHGALNLATGDDEKGLGATGGFGIDVAALTNKNLGRVWLNGQLGLRWAGEDSDTKMAPGLGIYVEGEAGCGIMEKTAAFVGLEVITYGDAQFDGNDVDDSGITNIDLNIGVGRMFTEKIGLRADIVYTVGGKNTDADIGILIGCRYGLK